MAVEGIGFKKMFLERFTGVMDKWIDGVLENPLIQHSNTPCSLSPNLFLKHYNSKRSPAFMGEPPSADFPSLYYIATQEKPLKRFP
jgi:hypothetical protein